MIGEIRDFETAQIAIQASPHRPPGAGHAAHQRCRQRRHAPDRHGGGALPARRSSLLGVLAQRLVRKYCGTATAQGCDACGHTGYAGRTGVFELLVADDAIRAQIHAQASEAEIRTAALAAGMTLMREDGERLIAAGITSREEVLRVTRD